MLRCFAQRLAAWGWLQALIDGSHPREMKALLVHGGLAAFFFVFHRKCAPYIFNPKP
jgi:hypothetical protein